jgi:hypothetical protein
MQGKPSKRLKKKLEEKGTRADARVLEIAEDGTPIRTGNRMHMKVWMVLETRLQVKPSDGTAEFEVSDRFAFQERTIPAAGDTIPVIFDPEDQDTLILDEAAMPVQPGFNAEALTARGLPAGAIDQVMQAQQQWGQLAQTMPAGALEPDVPTQIAALQALKEQGDLTEAEFEAEKAKILGAS